MATEEEKKRALAGLQLTPEGREYLSAQGVPEQVYRDPRDETLAATPALIRPIASMLDRMANPGRAGTAASMNLGLAQKAQQRQLDAAKLKGAQEDANMKELQMRAANGDTDALRQLRDYQNAMNAYRMQQTPFDYRQLLTGLDDGTGQARPISGAGNTPPAGGSPPAEQTLTEVENLTPTELATRAADDIADIDRRIADAENVINTGRVTTMIPDTSRPPTMGMPGGSGFPSEATPQYVRSTREATIGELNKAQATLTSLQKQRAQIQSTAERYSPTSSRQ